MKAAAKTFADFPAEAQVDMLTALRIAARAFQKKSKSGIKTPQTDVDRIKERLKRLKEALT